MKTIYKGKKHHLFGQKGHATTHGLSNTRFYQIWENLGTRIKNKKFKYYKNYGGRGIKCKWKSFEEFKTDMYPTYKENLTLERINNNGNYSKENCRWATRLEQANNTRQTRFFTFNGKTLTLTDWAKELNINRHTLSSRLEYGFSLDKVFKANKFKPGPKLF